MIPRRAKIQSLDLFRTYSETTKLKTVQQILHLIARTSMRTHSFSCFASNSAGKNLAMTSMFVPACDLVSPP